MARPRQTQPTGRELEILQVLWRTGPASTRDIVDELNRNRRKKLAYNSVLTILGIMQQKGYVTRDESLRTHIYEARSTQSEVESRLVERLINDVFGGSAMRLVSRALSTQVASRDEVEQVKELLDAMKGEDEPS